MKRADVVLVLLAAPLLLAVDTPAIGYAFGATAWIAVSGFGLAVDRHAGASADLTQQLALRVGYRFVRVLLLTAATVLALKVGANRDAVTTLLVITASYTLRLSISVLTRAVLPGSSRASRARRIRPLGHQ